MCDFLFDRDRLCVYISPAFLCTKTYTNQPKPPNPTHISQIYYIVFIFSFSLGNGTFAVSFFLALLLPSYIPYVNIYNTLGGCSAYKKKEIMLSFPSIL